MNDWVHTAIDLIARKEPAVLVSVMATRGSAPRDSGTRMIVCASRLFGTIGGGHLEYKATALAREQLLASPMTYAANGVSEKSIAQMDAESVTLRRFPLGASLGQCCGGLVNLLFEPLNHQSGQWLHYLHSHLQAGRSVVSITQALSDTTGHDAVAGIHKLLVSESDSHGDLVMGQQRAVVRARAQLASHGVLPDNTDPSLWFETLSPQDFQILIFGAGHVGKALVTTLATLPCHIAWIDSREAEFPNTLPSNVTRIVSEEPDMELARAPRHGYVIILTHSHALDEVLCSQALQNETLSWCGLIGSATKRRKFIQRLRARGMSEASLSRLTCPIGLPELSGKHPGEIAVSVAAQILGIRQQQLASRQPPDEATLSREFA